MRYGLSMKLLMVGGVVISTLSSTQLFSAKPAKLAGPLVTIISDTDQAKLEKTRTKLQKVARPVWASARKNGALLSSQDPVEDEMAVESLLSRLKALEVLTKQQENKNKILENNVIRLQHELTMATASITAGASESLSEGEGSEKQSLSDVSRRSSVPNSQVGESTVSRKIQGVRAQRSTPEELTPSDVEYTKRVAPMSGTKGQVVSTAVAGRSDAVKKETQRPLPVTREIRNVAQKLQPMETGEHVVYRERPFHDEPVEIFRSSEDFSTKANDLEREPSGGSKIVHTERVVVDNPKNLAYNNGSTTSSHSEDMDRLRQENERLRERSLNGFGNVYMGSVPQADSKHTTTEANEELKKIKEVSKSLASITVGSNQELNGTKQESTRQSAIGSTGEQNFEADSKSRVGNLKKTLDGSVEVGTASPRVATSSERVPTPLKNVDDSIPTPKPQPVKRSTPKLLPPPKDPAIEEKEIKKCQEEVWARYEYCKTVPDIPQKLSMIQDMCKKQKEFETIQMDLDRLKKPMGEYFSKKLQPGDEKIFRTPRGKALMFSMGVRNVSGKDLVSVNFPGHRDLAANADQLEAQGYIEHKIGELAKELVKIDDKLQDTRKAVLKLQKDVKGVFKMPYDEKLLDLFQKGKLVRDMRREDVDEITLKAKKIKWDEEVEAYNNVDSRKDLSVVPLSEFIEKALCEIYGK